jgi:hypothetical protein
MKLNEIRDLTEKEILELDGGHWFFGTARVSTNWHDLWLRFDNEGLQAVTWGSATDSKNTRLSPRFDLCSGDLSYLLTVTWTNDFVGANVLLDGELIEMNARVAPPIVLSTKPHELRVEVDGCLPIVRHFNLTADDRGDQSVFLSGEDLHPSS